MRLNKDPEEVELPEAAEQFADAAVETVLVTVKPEISEIDSLKASQESVLAHITRELDEIIYTWERVTGGSIYSGLRSAFPLWRNL